MTKELQKEKKCCDQKWKANLIKREFKIIKKSHQKRLSSTDSDKKALLYKSTIISHFIYVR